MNTHWLDRYIFAITAALGGIVFLFFYGWDIINPFQTQWLLAGGDLSQHYIGWQFFRQSAWTFPIGIAGDLAYPHGLAITFMDSIPLFAIPAKLIVGFTNEPIQYFGIWGLMSFMLSSGIFALIVRRWTKNISVILISSLIVLMMPIMLTRMFRHTALGGHWVVLLGVWILISQRNALTRRFVLWWSLCLGLSVMIHPYFLAVNVFLLTLGVVWGYRSIFVAAIRFTTPLLLAAFTTFVIGGLTVTSVGAGDLGKYGYDVASVINPQTWSRFFPGQVFASNGESSGYLGLGILLLFLAALIVAAINWRAVAQRARSEGVKFIVMSVLIFLMIFIAVGPHVVVAGNSIVDYHLPVVIEKIWSIVRATARMIWPLYYLALTGALYLVIKYVSVKKQYITIAIVMIIALVQTIDVIGSPQATARFTDGHNVARMQYHTTLNDERWDDVAKDKRHIVYVGYVYGVAFRDLSQLAIKHNMTLNNGYFARSPEVAIRKGLSQAKYELSSGKPRRDTVYVVKSVDKKELHPEVNDVIDLNDFSVVSESGR